MTESKPRLLVSAYAYSPTIGSEFAQGWNFVHQASKHYDTTVLIGSSDGRMGEYEEIDNWLRSNDPRVNIVKVQGPCLALLANYLDQKLGFSWAFVFSLRFWHAEALQVARRLHNERAFDIVHQLGPVGFRNPGYMYKLGVPSYWGPIGGIQYVNLKLAFKSSLRFGVIALIRNVLTWLALHSPTTKRAALGFDAVSFATSQNKMLFERAYKKKGPICSDQACFENPQAGSPNPLVSAPLKVMWCGSVDDRKNIKLLMTICKTCQNAGLDVSFKVIGGGPRLKWAQTFAKKNALKNVVLTGRVPRGQVASEMKAADVLVFTSLSEANTSTFFEGLQKTCIPVALDLDGFSTNITSKIGFKIDTDQPYIKIVNDYVFVLRELSMNHDYICQLRSNIKESLASYSWEELFLRHHKQLVDIGLK